MEKSVLENIQDPHVENRYNLTPTSAQYPAPQHGGRVPNINDPSTRDFPARPASMHTGGKPIPGFTPRQDLIGHIHKPTPLNEVFFSQANIEKLQKSIQEQVYLMSGPKKFMIDRQNDDDLKIIMRSYYLSYAKNNPATVAEELADLNGRTIGFAAGRVYSEVDFHKFYLKDLEEFASPIANPINTASYGTRTGELKSFF
jgi:hypothetical protein